MHDDNSTTGLGLGIIYLPRLDCITQYFDKKRPFVTGDYMIIMIIIIVILIDIVLMIIMVIIVMIITHIPHVISSYSYIILP